VTRRLLACACALAGAAALAACGDDGGDEPLVRPLVGEIVPAMAAVETELGGPQDYYEVNATPQLVNLWVATGGGATATPYVVLDGEVQPPAPAQPVEQGATFRADAVDFDPDSIFAALDDELDQPAITQFVVVGGPGGAVQYSAAVTSSEGGVLDVLLGPDGAVLGVDPG
jgi:hypothetical protein